MRNSKQKQLEQQKRSEKYKNKNPYLRERRKKNDEEKQRRKIEGDLKATQVPYLCQGQPKTDFLQEEQKIILCLNLLFWTVMRCDIGHFGQRGLSISLSLNINHADAA